jgi:hypothetical protein
MIVCLKSLNSFKLLIRQKKSQNHFEAEIKHKKIQKCIKEIENNLKLSLIQVFWALTFSFVSNLFFINLIVIFM